MCDYTSEEIEEVYRKRREYYEGKQTEAPGWLWALAILVALGALAYQIYSVFKYQ